VRLPVTRRTRRAVNRYAASLTRSIAPAAPRAHLYCLRLAGACDGFECFAAASFAQQVEESGGDDAVDCIG
jgi:hypothetical protein